MSHTAPDFGADLQLRSGVAVSQSSTFCRTRAASDCMVSRSMPHIRSISKLEALCARRGCAGRAGRRVPGATFPRVFSFPLPLAVGVVLGGRRARHDLAGMGAGLHRAHRTGSPHSAGDEGGCPDTSDADLRMEGPPRGATNGLYFANPRRGCCPPSSSRPACPSGLGRCCRTRRQRSGSSVTLRADSRPPVGRGRRRGAAGPRCRPARRQGRRRTHRSVRRPVRRGR
jgi:hypothetical protein